MVKRAKFNSRHKFVSSITKIISTVQVSVIYL